MPSVWWTLCQEIKEYLRECREERNYSDYTIRDYEYALNRQFQALKDKGMNFNPRKIGKKELIFLRDEHFFGRAPRYIWNMISMLMCFCKWAGNSELARVKMSWGDTSRTNVRWLDEDEVSIIMNAVETPLERLVIHCELALGMRRVEVQRLRLDSFHFGRENYVIVQGKGRNGGKYRRIPTRRDTRELLEDYLRYRKGIVGSKTDNGLLMVHLWKSSISGYGKTGIDKILDKLSLRAGVKFSNHDLRRTFGRRMYRSGVAIEEIASILGHEDTKMTLKYLGLEHDDLSGAMEKYYQYDKKTVFPKMEILSVSQEKSGQGGI
jgi:integrase/recombinase XerD